MSLQEDVSQSEARCESLRMTWVKEMEDLKDLIGNRASIPKDLV